jgi:ABC-type transport system substrate-binding protein
VPITADDFLFAERLYSDPGLWGAPPFTLMTLTAPDSHTVRIQWQNLYGDYLAALTQLMPLPLHVYAIGPYAGVYDPRTSGYNPRLAQKLVASGDFNTAFVVDSGPFTPKSFAPGDRFVLVKNPRFFSNFFHPPALDQVTFVT